MEVHSARSAALAISRLAMLAVAVLLPLPLIVGLVRSSFLEYSDFRVAIPFASSSGPSAERPVTRLTISPVSLDRSTQRATILVQLDFPRGLAGALRSERRAREHDPSAGPEMLRLVMTAPSQPNLPRAFRLQAQPNIGRIPWDAVSSAPGAPHDFSQSVPIDVHGATDHYPGDEYFTYREFELSIPATLEQLPLDVRSADPRGGPIELSTTPFGLATHLRFRTAGLTKYFAYSTAFVPLILVVLGFLIARARPLGGRNDFPWVIGLGVVAAIPIRQVTVPTDLAGVTRVDLLLGLAVVIAGSFVLLMTANAIGRETVKEDD
jgi:hypothetical protein